MKLLKIMMLLLAVCAVSIDAYMLMFHTAGANEENFIEPLVLILCTVYLFYPTKKDNGEKALVCAVFLMELLVINHAFAWQLIAFVIMTALILLCYLPQVKLSTKLRTLLKVPMTLGFVVLILYYTYIALPMYVFRFTGYNLLDAVFR